MKGFLEHWHWFFLFASSQGLFLSILLFSAKSLDKKNRLLGALMLLHSISIVDNVWFWSGYYQEFPHLLGISMSFDFLYGPILYFYIKEAIKSNSVRIMLDWKHLMLPGLILLYLSHYYVGDSNQKLDLIANWNLNPINVFVLPCCGIASLIYYGFKIFEYLKSYEKRLSTQLIGLENWLSQIWIVFGLYTVLVPINYILLLTSNSTDQSDYIIAMASAIFIYFIGYLGFSKSKLLNGIKANDLKYQSSTLTSSISARLFDQVKEHLEQSQVYTNNELRLSRLADELSISSHQLSQIINEHAGKNFSDFINNYRVQEATKRMKSDSRINLLAYEVGFNNKTSFNNAFKKFVGCSPTEFKKKLA